MAMPDLLLQPCNLNLFKNVEDIVVFLTLLFFNGGSISLTVLLKALSDLKQMGFSSIMLIGNYYFQSWRVSYLILIKFLFLF